MHYKIKVADNYSAGLQVLTHHVHLSGCALTNERLLMTHHYWQHVLSSLLSSLLDFLCFAFTTNVLTHTGRTFAAKKP